MEPLVKSLDEFLGERGLASPISDFMVDKIKVPRGLTLRKRKTLEKEAAEASQQYSKQRKAAVEEYNRLLSEGKIREPSNIERLLKVASGHEDNSATQAARRALEKRGVDWQTGLKLTEQRSREKYATLDERIHSIEQRKLNNSCHETIQGKGFTTIR
ncbi:MAG: hypothetical protein IJZ42_01480 [Lachnospiraceae bacterium]|nr:hypothetical protein [Lachnospiraceae bacterium]